MTNAGLIYWENLGSTLYVNGNYTGNAGKISLGTDLGDDNSITDKLVIAKDSIGTTSVTVRPEGNISWSTNSRRNKNSRCAR